MSTGRAEAFSDGVFAIAITLLVLSLKLSGTGSVGVILPVSISRASSWVWWITW